MVDDRKASHTLIYFYRDCFLQRIFRSIYSLSLLFIHLTAQKAFSDSKKELLAPSSSFFLHIYLWKYRLCRGTKANESNECPDPELSQYIPRTLCRNSIILRESKKHTPLRHTRFCWDYPYLVQRRILFPVRIGWSPGSHYRTYSDGDYDDREAHTRSESMVSIICSICHRHCVHCLIFSIWVNVLSTLYEPSTDNYVSNLCYRDRTPRSWTQRSLNQNCTDVNGGHHYAPRTYSSDHHCRYLGQSNSYIDKPYWDYGGFWFYNLSLISGEPIIKKLTKI